VSFFAPGSVQEAVFAQDDVQNRRLACSHRFHVNFNHDFR
jgi:hypothetical protein